MQLICSDGREEEKKDKKINLLANVLSLETQQSIDIHKLVSDNVLFVPNLARISLIYLFVIIIIEFERCFE